MKSYEDCKKEVAKKYGFGKLVMGHLVKYYDEAAEMYADQFRKPVAITPEITSFRTKEVQVLYGEKKIDRTEKFLLDILIAVEQEEGKVGKRITYEWKRDEFIKNKEV